MVGLCKGTGFVEYLREENFWTGFDRSLTGSPVPHISVIPVSCDPITMGSQINLYRFSYVLTPPNVILH